MPTSLEFCFLPDFNGLIWEVIIKYMNPLLITTALACEHEEVLICLGKIQSWDKWFQLKIELCLLTPS